MKLKSKGLAVIVSSVLLAGGLVGCTQNDSDSDQKADEPKKETTQEAAGEDDVVSINNPKGKPEYCGLQEQEGPQGLEFGPFTGNIMFFQPGAMFENPESDMKMNSYEDSQMHLELDLKANEFGSNFGYSVDETPANLHIMYEISDSDGKVIMKDMMMPMNAIDGSHYGTNLKNDTIKNPGKYKIKITIYPPKNYDLHKDYITGVPHPEWFKPLTVEADWEISQEQLDIVKANKVKDYMAVPDKCKDFPKKMFENDKTKKQEEAMKSAETVEPVKH